MTCDNINDSSPAIKWWKRLKKQNRHKTIAILSPAEQTEHSTLHTYYISFIPCAVRCCAVWYDDYWIVSLAFFGRWIVGVDNHFFFFFICDFTLIWKGIALPGHLPYYFITSFILRILWRAFSQPMNINRFLDW